MFEVKKLRLLHELKLRGTLFAVAEALSYSPSTVSQQLAMLEKDAGVKLLVPVGRKVQLTPEGELLASYAREVLNRDEEIRAALKSSNTQLAGTIRISAFQSATLAVVPKAIMKLQEDHPQLRVEFREIAPEEGLFGLVARNFDLVIAEQYPGLSRVYNRELKRQDLFKDQLRLAVPMSVKARSMHDVKNLPWVLEPEGTVSRQWAIQQCRKHGFEPDIRYETSDLMSQVRFIRSGAAVGILPDLIWEIMRPGLRLIDLEGNPHREVFASTRESTGDSAFVREFIASMDVVTADSQFIIHV